MAFTSPYRRRPSLRSANDSSPAGAAAAAASPFQAPRSLRFSSVESGSTKLTPPLHTNWEFYLSEEAPVDTSVEEFSTTITPRPAYSTSPDPKVLVPLDASGTSPRHPAAFTPSSLGLLIRTTLVRIPGEMQRSFHANPALRKSAPADSRSPSGSPVSNTGLDIELPLPPAACDLGRTTNGMLRSLSRPGHLPENTPTWQRYSSSPGSTSSPSGPASALLTPSTDGPTASARQSRAWTGGIAASGRGEALSEDPYHEFATFGGARQSPATGAGQGAPKPLHPQPLFLPNLSKVAEHGQPATPSVARIQEFGEDTDDPNLAALSLTSPRLTERQQVRMSSSVVDFDPPQEEPLEASSAVSRSDIGRWGSEGDESSQVDASVLEDSYVPSPPVTSHPAVISRPSKSFAGLRWDEAGQDAPASPLSPSARRMSSAPAGTAPLDLIPDASALSKPGVSQMATPGIVPQLMADAESVASEPSRHSFDCCSSKDTDPLPASPSRQQNQQRSAHLHAAGVQALVSGRMTPDGLRQSLQSWEGKSANSSPLKETLSVPPQRQEVLVWAVDTPDSSSTAQVLQGGANWHHKALSPELRPASPPLSFCPGDPSADGIPSTIPTPCSSHIHGGSFVSTSAAEYMTAEEEGEESAPYSSPWGATSVPSVQEPVPDVRGRLEALPPANRTADLPTARKDSTHNSSFNIVGSFAGIGFQPLSEELCLEDDSAYRQVEAEVARALEELTRQQESNTELAKRRRMRAEAVRQHWKAESTSAAERLRLAGVRLVSEAVAFQRRASEAAKARERLQRELEATSAEASELGVERAAAEIAAEGAAMGVLAAGKVHEEAQRLQEWVQFGEATVLADAQCRVEAALAELERCRSVAAMQRCRIAEVKALASGLARREGQLAELCQDLIKLSELAALAQGHKGIFDKLNYRNLTADDINEELNNSGVLDSLNPEADGFEAPINAMHRTADSCRALVHNLHHEEHRVVEAVTAAVEEAEAEAAGFALDPLAAWAERVLTSDNVGCSEVCETPGTVGEAQQLLKEAMGLPDISTAEGGRYTGALIGGEVICAAREDMRWELGPAQRLALCMLITRLREVRASLSSTSVELMRAESAATAAQAMCGAIARRRAAAETEVLHLKNEYQRTLQLSNVEDVQRYALELQQRAKDQAGKAAGAAELQLAKLEQDRSRIAAEMEQETVALTKLRATLEGRWAEMVKARAEYRRVRLKYQRDMARVYSGQELVGGDDPSDAASTNLVKKSLGSLAGSPPPPPADAIHGVLSELLSRAEEELRGAFSLERGAEPMPLPEGRQRNQQEEQQWSFCGSDGSPVPHDAASALRMSTGSSVLIGASYLADDCLYHSTGATNGSSVGSVASTGHCTTAATAGGSTPRHLSLSMSPGMAACLIASPRAASTSPTPHNKQRTVVGQATAATGGVSRMGMKPPALRAKLPMGGTQGGRSKGVAGPKGHKGARKGPRKGHQVGTPQTSAAVEVQWRVVEGLMRGCEVLVVEPKDGKDAPRSNRASDPSMLLDTSRDTCDPSDRLGNPTALNLSSDYARLIFRRRGSHLSSFIRVADIVGLTDQGQWEFAASDAALQPAANLRASGAKSRGRKAVEPQGGDSTLIVVALPTLVVHLRDRNVTVAYHNPEEHVVWFEGLCLLLAHQDCLPRLKASLAPFQHPYLFANSRMAH